MTKRGPTIKDVAKQAGVSIATVSNVLNGTRFVSHELQKRVRQAVENLGYQPSAFGQGLRTGEALSIGVLLPDSRNQFFQIIAEGIEQEAELHQNSVWYCNTRDEPSRERTCLSRMVGRGVDGIIIAPSPGGRENLRPFIENRLPIVVIVRQIEQLEVDQVFADSIGGAYEATRHLIGLGHRHIGLLTGMREVQTFKERLFGYQTALLDHSIPFDPALVLDAYSHVEEGFRAAQYLMEKTDATAIFATNFPMTLGALKAIQEMGLECPREISLVGFDNLDCAVVVRPRLTVVDQKPHDIGHMAGRLLFDRLKPSGRAERTARTIKIPPELILRDSTSDARASRPRLLTNT